MTLGDSCLLSRYVASQQYTDIQSVTIVKRRKCSIVGATPGSRCYFGDLPHINRGIAVAWRVKSVYWKVVISTSAERASRQIRRWLGGPEMKFSRGMMMLLAVCTSTFLMAGCSRDTNPVRDVFVSAGVGAKVPPAPDFVTNTRPAQVDYIPVGLKAPPRKYPAKTPEQLKAVEGQMDAVRTRTESQGIRVQQEGQTASSPTGQ